MRIFQKPKGLFKLFQKFKPTDEAYANAIEILPAINPASTLLNMTKDNVSAKARMT